MIQVGESAVRPLHLLYRALCVCGRDARQSSRSVLLHSLIITAGMHPCVELHIVADWCWGRG